MPDKPSKRRVGKVKAVRALKEQADGILSQTTPTPMGEPHRLPNEININSVASILDAIVALSDDEIDFLFSMLDSGMWDEWDCSLIGGIEMGMGAAEIRLAAKSGTGTAKWIATHPTP